MFLHLACEEATHKVWVERDDKIGRVAEVVLNLWLDKHRGVEARPELGAFPGVQRLFYEVSAGANRTMAGHSRVSKNNEVAGGPRVEESGCKFIKLVRERERECGGRRKTTAAGALVTARRDPEGEWRQASLPARAIEGPVSHPPHPPSSNSTARDPPLRRAVRPGVVHRLSGGEMLTRQGIASTTARGAGASSVPVRAGRLAVHKAIRVHGPRDSEARLTSPAFVSGHTPTGSREAAARIGPLTRGVWVSSPPFFVWVLCPCDEDQARHDAASVERGRPSRGKVRVVRRVPVLVGCKVPIRLTGWVGDKVAVFLAFERPRATTSASALAKKTDFAEGQ
ncbi:hypothetical protein B0H11DRAFT_1928118 [Mycena galericulata]|nr:hypothetical protein B0H11DRAFT_1928118 [Mycena galericulata]